MPLLTDSLTIPPASTLNNTGKSAALRQLAAAASQAVVPLVYGEDRISGLILNVLTAAGTPGTLLVQVLWCHACDSVNDVQLNDQPLPASASITHYTGAQTSTDTTLAAALGAQGIGGVRPLTGYAWSLLAMPAALFDGQLNVTARIRGRRCYDPAFDSTAGGTGPQRLADPSTWAYTDIPAVCLGDFLASTVYGCGVAVNWDSVRNTGAANREIVPGSSEQRRLVGVSFGAAAPANEVAETLRAYACCFLLPSASGVRLIPDQNDASMVTYRHSSGDIAAIEALELRDAGQAPTAVEVIYTDRSAIPWRDASAIAKLTGAGTTKPWRLSQVRLPGVQRYGQALREATERLNKLVLNDITTTVEVFDVGIKHDLGDLITVDHPLGLSMTTMRISGPPTMPSPGRWRLPLVRHSSAAYSNIVASAAAIQDAQRIVPAPARLAIKLNVGDFAGTVNYSEAYLHAVDAAGNALDAPGTILVNGVGTAVPNGSLFTNLGPAAGYIVWDSAGATFNTGPGLRPYVFARRYQGQWQYDSNAYSGATDWVNFTPASTHFVIGTLQSGGPDTGNPGSPPGLTASSIYAAAVTLDRVQWDELAGRPADSALLNSYITMNADGTISGAGGGGATLQGMGLNTYRIISAGFSSTPPAAAGVYKNGALVGGDARSYTLAVIRRSDGVMTSNDAYDVFAGASAAAALATALNALTSDYIAVVHTADEPQGNRLSSGLDAAMYRCGASKAVFGSPQFKSRSAYVLIGIAGCGEGNGAEAYQGSVDNDANAWVDVGFALRGGNIVGVNAAYTPRTLADYSYSGDLDATKGAPAGTYVAGQLAQDLVTTASTAASAASTAATNASSALSTLATMRSNGYIDASEKPALIRQWQAIADEASGIYAKGTAYGLTAARDAYWSAYGALGSYLSSLSPSWSDTTVDTPITPATDQTTWAAYYSTRQALLNAIYDEAAKRAEWSQVSGSGKPQDNATQNDVVYSSFAPTSPTYRMTWIDTSVTPRTIKIWSGSAWLLAGTYVNGTAQIVDDANLGLTAIWSGVAGSGKPADNATRNQVFFQDGDPTVSPGGVVDGAIWISSTKAWQRVSGAWQPYVGTGSIGTGELGAGSATDVLWTSASDSDIFSASGSTVGTMLLSYLAPYDCDVVVSTTGNIDQICSVAQWSTYADITANTSLTVSETTVRARNVSSGDPFAKGTLAITKRFFQAAGTTVFYTLVGVSGGFPRTGPQAGCACWFRNQQMVLEAIKR